MAPFSPLTLYWKFDNEYFKNLLGLKWTKREWDGPEQYEDESGTLMMLPTDMATTITALATPRPASEIQSRTARA